MARICGVGKPRALQRALEAILEDIDAFAGEAPQHDDRTLLVVRYEPAKATEPGPGSV